LISGISFGSIRHNEDYSSFPTCFTFGDSFSSSRPVHSYEGRAVYLFQTKFSQIGTNTVGNNLGGTRYAELSIAGSVHGDEVRPPFLVGHFPRLALKLWRMGTGDAKDVQDGLELVRSLEQVIESGSPAIRVFFSHTDESVLNALIGTKKNQVQGFAQLYSVTRRAADHQWWKRDFGKAVALPTRDSSSTNFFGNRVCHITVPGKIAEIPIELILTTTVIGMLLLRIFFAGERRSKNGKGEKSKK
jgi:hypothetical protein